jgi:hypothetical protein
VERTQDGHTVKIAEITLNSTEDLRMLPVDGRAYSPAELQDVCAFMEAFLPSINHRRAAKPVGEHEPEIEMLRR